ncbi:MAG: hypothetical protein ACI9WU_002494 [Myxococcota bacterium]|jgi:hypothetical protein
MKHTLWPVVMGMVIFALGCGEEEVEVPAISSPPMGPIIDPKMPFIPTANTADLPNRCAADRNVWETKPLCPAGPAHGARGAGSGGRHFAAGVCDFEEMGYEDELTLLIDGMLYSDLRRFPEVIHFHWKTDYYSNREGIQAALKARIDGMPAVEQDAAWANYSLLMVYLGEFKKVTEVFGPGGPQSERANFDPSVVFDLSHAYFRLGDYATSHVYALRAVKWIPGHDTKWQLALTEIGLYGEEYYERASTDIYSLEHVKKVFPAHNLEKFPFEDVSVEMGVHDYRWGGYGGVNWADMDGDGWDDLLAEYKFFPPKIWRNIDGKRFEAVSDENMGASDCSSVFWSPADYDNDGVRDIVRHCCTYDSTGPMTLMKGTGDKVMSFKEVSESANLRVPTEKYPGAGSAMVLAWGDIELDGDLDLLAGDYTGPVRLYVNQGDGTFIENQDGAGMNTPGKPGEFGSIGASFGDIDDDGYPEIWTQGWGWKRLYKNNKDGTFTNITQDVGLPADDTADKGYMAFTLDYNNDGHLDLFAGAFVTSDETPLGVEAVCGCHKLLADDGYDEHEWTTSSTIWRNNGDNTFTNIAAQTGFVPFGAMGSNAADWNNDGYQDLMISSGGSYYQQLEPFLFYQNKGGTGEFELLTPWNNLATWGKSHGMAFADMDRDGDLDAFLNSGGFMPGDVFPSALLRNTGNENHWFEVSLKSGKPGTNTDSVGAKVWVEYGDGLKQVQELWSGGRFGATNSFRIHFGMAEYKTIKKVTIRWPNADLATTVLENIDTDQAIEVNELDGTWKTLWTKSPTPAN